MLRTIVSGVLPLIFSIAIVHNLIFLEMSVESFAIIIPLAAMLRSATASTFVSLFGGALILVSLPFNDLSVSLALMALLSVSHILSLSTIHRMFRLFFVAIAAPMFLGVVWMQFSQEIQGHGLASIAQILGMFCLFVGLNSWKTVRMDRISLMVSIMMLLACSFVSEALLGLLVVGAIYSLQNMKNHTFKMTMWWLIPSIAFVTAIVSPSVTIPTVMSVIWILAVSTFWMGEQITSESH